MLDLNEQKRKTLEFITEEKDLGVIIDHKLNFSSHIVEQVIKANKMMGLIRRSDTHLEHLFIALLMQFLSQSAFRILLFDLVSASQKR